MVSNRRMDLIVLSMVVLFGLLSSSPNATLVHASNDAASSGVGFPTIKPNLPCKGTRFDRNKFSNPTRIDNKMFPMVPGTQYILEGTSNLGQGILPHRVIFTVTDLTKMINGVRTVVMYDRDINHGQLEEAELAFFAQDDDGNVWNLGEYPELYEDGQFIGAPDTWVAGIADAKAGVHMHANPRVGTPSYLQGYAPDIDFLDCARVFKQAKKICVPAGCFGNILITDEWSPLEPNSGRQRKYHAPGFGIIRIGAVRDPQAETLVLSKVIRLQPPNWGEGTESLVDVRNAALELDKRAYWVSPDVWGNTPPAE